MGVTTLLPLLSTRVQAKPILELLDLLGVMAWMFVTPPSHMLKPFPSPCEGSGRGPLGGD